MSEITTLFTQYSVEELILLIIIVLFVLRALNEIFTYFYHKLKNHFGIETQKQSWEKEIVESLESIKEEIQTLKKQNTQTHKHQKEIDSAVSLVQERLQENTRSYLIDAHHKFCYEVHAIDELSLQAMERRYLYYKTAGGNSFIDNLMDEVRLLPKINFYTGMIDNDHNGIDDRREQQIND